MRDAGKPGTLRNGTQLELEVIDAQYGRRCWTCGQKLALIGASMSAPHTGELAGGFSICMYGTFVIL